MKDPERFALVRKMFDLLLTGAHTAPHILERATNQWGLRTRRGLKVSLSNIYEIFRNPFYYGLFEFPSGSGNWYNGAHEAMMTAAEYDRVQQILGRNDGPRPRRHSFAFVGSMRCGECGAAVTAESKTKHQQNGKNHSYVYYHCTKKRNADCGQRCVEEQKLLAQIMGFVDSFSIPTDFYAYALKWFRSEQEKEATKHRSVTDARQQAYKSCEQKLDKLIDMRAAELITEEEFLRKRAELLREKARFGSAASQTPDGTLRVAEDMLTFIRDMKDRLRKGTPEEQREVLLALGSNHRLTGKKLTLELQKPLLPMGKAAHLVREIHERFEPRTIGLTERNFEAVYERIPAVSALLEKARTEIRSLAGYSPFRIVAGWGEKSVGGGRSSACQTDAA